MQAFLLVARCDAQVLGAGRCGDNIIGINASWFDSERGLVVGSMPLPIGHTVTKRGRASEAPGYRAACQVVDVMSACLDERLFAS